MIAHKHNVELFRDGYSRGCFCDTEGCGLHWRKFVRHLDTVLVEKVNHRTRNIDRVLFQYEDGDILSFELDSDYKPRDEAGNIIEIRN